MLTYRWRFTQTSMSLKLHRFRIKCDGVLFTGRGRHMLPLATFLVCGASLICYFQEF